MSRPSIRITLAIALVVVVACTRTDAPAASSVDAPQAPRSTTVDTPPPPEPAAPQPVAEPWCDVPVHELAGLPGDEGPTLRERIGTAPVVTVGTVTLSESDCSAVGHGHLVLESIRGAEPRVDDAHASFPLTGSFPPKAPYYLVGARPHDARPLDLTKVCLGKLERIDARALWVLPIGDEAERDAWLERLARGTCGRPPGASPAKAEPAQEATNDPERRRPKEKPPRSEPSTAAEDLLSGKRRGKMEIRYRAGPTEVRIDRRSVTGDGAAIVHSMLGLFRSRFRDCHQKIMGGELGSSSEDRSGKMKLAIEASAAAGAKAKILSDEVGDDRLRQCILDSVNGLRAAKDDKPLSYGVHLNIRFTTKSFERRPCPNCGK